MQYFVFILLNVITPIFIQIFAGFLLKKFVKFNIDSIATVQLYILIPALLFSKMYSSNINLAIVIKLLIHSLVLFIVLYLLCILIIKIFKFKNQESSVFINSIILYNSGNYCIPLVQLLYNNPLALSFQMLIMMTQNIITNTIGIFISNTSEKNIKKAIMEVLKVPMIYSIILAVFLKVSGITVWKPILDATNSLGNGLVPLALLTLGAQLAETKFFIITGKVYFSTFLRLIISPILAFFLVKTIGLTGIVAEVAIISSAAPTAVNSVLLAIKYNGNKEYASQAIFISTLLSSITVSITIFLVFNKL